MSPDTDQPARVAALQLNSADDPQNNLHRVSTFAEQAKANGAQLLVLPEMWACIGRRDAMDKASTTASAQFLLDALCELAAGLDLWIVAGSLGWPASTESVKSKNLARCYVIDGQGQLRAHYDKIHLFDVDVEGERQYCESRYYEAGENVVVVDSPVGKLGLAICYDLRFPELFRQLWRRGAEVLVLPSAFTELTGRAHWQALLRARAIENSCYMVAANQWGDHPDGRSTWGHSAVLDPWGDSLGMLDSGEGLVLADIDLEKLHGIRNKMPCHKHVRLKL